MRTEESVLHLAGTAWPATFAGDARMALASGAKALDQGRIPDLNLVWRSLRNSPRHRGAPVENKYELLERFQIALVIENSLDYISEKLFDAIAAGCFPIYVGPRLEDMGLDPDLALSVPPTPEFIREALSKVTSPDVKRVAAAHERFVQDNLSDWSACKVLTDLGMKVGRALSVDQLSG